jgi:hypothetical protein
MKFTLPTRSSPSRARNISTANTDPLAPVTASVIFKLEEADSTSRLTRTIIADIDYSRGSRTHRHLRQPSLRQPARSQQPAARTSPQPEQHASGTPETSPGKRYKQSKRPQPSTPVPHKSTQSNHSPRYPQRIKRLTSNKLNIPNRSNCYRNRKHYNDPSVISLLHLRIRLPLQRLAATANFLSRPDKTRHPQMPYPRVLGLTLSRETVCPL